MTSLHQLIQGIVDNSRCSLVALLVVSVVVSSSTVKTHFVRPSLSPNVDTRPGLFPSLKYKSDFIDLKYCMSPSTLN